MPPGVVRAGVVMPENSTAQEGVWNESEDYFYAEFAPPPAPTQPPAPVETATPIENSTATSAAPVSAAPPFP
jgi:hypothetical protein